MPRAGRKTARSRRWTETEAKSVLAALDASGMSVPAFAAREGLLAKRLYDWRRRLASPKPRRATAPAFVEIQRQVVGVVEVVLRSGRVLRVSESIDSAVLRRLAVALEDAAGC